MDRVEPEGIDVKLLSPVESILNKKIPDRVAIRTIEIERQTPGRLVAFREVGAKVREVISLRPEVVINHIKDHGHAMVVTGIDEPFKTRRPAVRLQHSERLDTVIAPVPIPGELRHCHDLDR